MADLTGQELPYLPRRNVSAQTVGASDPTKELARSPGQSSHYASPYRTMALKTLGLKETGFFADWRQRTMRPQQQGAQDLTPEITDTNLQGPKFNKFGQAAITQQLGPKAPGPTQWRPPQEDQQAGGSFTGLTRYQLRQTEMSSVGAQIRGRIASNPLLNTSVLDTMDANQINMDRQVLMDMNNNPSELLGAALQKYYLKTPPDGASDQTNFEKIVSKYSETKKIAEKQIGYAAAEMGKKMAQLKKNPTYTGAANMVNIGVNSYSPTYYAPTFG